jgi:hypothetical protein
MQTPPVVTSIMQQIMPYLVALLVIILTSLGVLVKAWVAKIVNQLQVNHAATVAAAQVSASATAAVASKVETVIDNTNGVNARLQQHIDTSQKTIDELRANQKPL